MADEERTSILKSIRELKNGEPFHPFVIVISSGDRYLIESGENLVEMRTEFFYATPGGEKFAFIRKHQIAAVEGSSEKPSARRKTRRTG